MRRLSAVLVLLLATLVLPSCGGSGDPTSPTPQRTLTYVAMGASDAVGIGALPLSRGYVFDLRDRMEARDFRLELSNLGISGAKIDEIASGSLGPAIAARPDVITLWAGPNDLVAGRTPERFASDLEALLRELRSRTGALVFVGNLPDLTRAPLFQAQPDPDVTAGRIAAFNERIQAVAAASGCVLVRLSELPAEPELFFVDGFHPSNLGHRRIADLFWSEISSRI